MHTDFNTDRIRSVIKPDAALIKRTKQAVSAAESAPRQNKTARFLLPSAAVFAAVCVAVYFGTGRAPKNDPTAVTPTPSTLPALSAESGYEGETAYEDGVSGGAPTQPSIAPDTSDPVTAAPRPADENTPSEKPTEQPPGVVTGTTRPADDSATEGPPTADATEPSTGPSADPSTENGMGSFSSNVTSVLLGDRLYVRTLQELVEKDRLIALVVSGTVKSTRVFRFEDTVYTRVTLSVETCLKGTAAPGQEIAFVEYGGEIDGHIWNYNVYRTSKPGDRLVVFLENVTNEFSEKALDGERAYCPAVATQGTFLWTVNLNGQGAYYCCGNVYRIEKDPKANTGFQYEDFVAVLQQ